MTLLLTILGRLGLADRYRRAAAVAALILAALVVLAVLKSRYDRTVVERHQARIEARTAPARAQADAERARDVSINSVNLEDLNDAIDTAPQGGTLSPAAHALACQRLRKLGRVPAACRAGLAD